MVYTTTAMGYFWGCFMALALPHYGYSIFGGNELERW
jgi:hypothetical protein